MTIASAEPAPKHLYNFLEKLGISRESNIYYQVSRENLQRHSVDLELGEETRDGVLAIKTGKFTGRSPKDRYIVEDDLTRDKVDWGKVNKPFPKEKFALLKAKICKFLDKKEFYVRDCYAVADERYRWKIRTICRYPWSSLFISNMFIELKEGQSFDNPDWLVINAPMFEADVSVDGTESKNFSIISFSEKTVLIGGTGYTGEMKKGIFSALNFSLPTEENVLPMHCSANIGEEGDTALFFGLSGTGKTTLSADTKRRLIGDDEHGWAEDGTIFNFEGGCYAKVIGLKKENEPSIFNAIRKGALLENVILSKDTKEVMYEDDSITENTRVSYPLEFIDNAVIPSIGKSPKNIFFLTCDAFGVLPPASKLSPAQAAYHFISGYTAKVAGTEEGVTDPQPNFSACFGAPFMSLHPVFYAKMLIKKMEETNAKVWLINTGWIGGGYGVGKRIDLQDTRNIITAIIAEQVDEDKQDYHEHRFFSLRYPTACPNVESRILSPRKSWESWDEYQKSAKALAMKFHQNFEKFRNNADKDIYSGSPIFGREES